jgi:hypothetical protein
VVNHVRVCCWGKKLVLSVVKTQGVEASGDGPGINQSGTV